MAIEYPVKIKFDYDNSELSKVQDKVNASPKGKKEKPGTATKKSEILLGGILGKIGIIAAILASLQNILQPILDVISYFVFLGFINLYTVAKDTLDWIKNLMAAMGLIGKEEEPVKPGEEALVAGQKSGIATTDKEPGNIFETLIGWGELAGAWLWENVILGGWQGLINVGQWIWENIIIPGWAHLMYVGDWIWKNIIIAGWEGLIDVGDWIWKNIIIAGWEGLIDVGDWIWENIIIPGWAHLMYVGQWIWTNIVIPGWNIVKNFGIWIWRRIVKPGWDYLKNIGKWIWNTIIEPAWSFLKDVGSRIYNEYIKPAFEYVKNTIKSAIDIVLTYISTLTGGLIGGRQFGGVIPETGPYLLHAGEQVSRGNTTNVSNAPNITINVEGGNDSGIVEEIATRLNEELYAYSRW
jgi:hypothetical protein